MSGLLKDLATYLGYPPGTHIRDTNGAKINGPHLEFIELL